jgi:quercetin dioxygenase-like cupin family protein
MKSARTRIALVVALAVCAGVATIGVLYAQQAAAAPAVKRTPVLKQDMLIPGKEAIMAIVELPPGSTEGKHIHPTAEVFAFVVEGTIVLDIDGKPSQTLNAGDHFYVAPGQVHQGSNKGTAPAKIYVTFVNDKDKPLTTPVK